MNAMADGGESREDLLRREYLGQTARIRWRDLQTHFARGSVVVVTAELDLVEVAVQLGLDNTEQFQRWIDGGQIAAANDDQAVLWFSENAEFWAVVAAPWVLVQDKQ